MIINGFRKVLDNYNKTHKHLSLRAVGRITGASTYSITALYNGKANGIKFNVLNKLVKFFNVPLTKILNYKDESLKFFLFNLGSKSEKHISKGLNLHSQNSIILSDLKRIYFIFSVTNIAFLANLDSISVDNVFHDSNMTPLHSDINKFDRLEVSIQVKYFGNTNSKNFALNLLKNLPNYFKDYIFVRALLHSKLLNAQNHKRYYYDFSSDKCSNNLQFQHSIKPVTLSELVKWQSSQTKKYQAKKSQCYYLNTKYNNFLINLYDDTTNNFKD